MDEVFHKGERTIQAKVGEELQAHANGRIIHDKIIMGAIRFIEQQPMAVISSVDDARNIWISLLIGDYGFASVLTPENLSFRKDLIYSNKDDIFFKNIINNNQIGTLFIELITRKRFRINGTATISENEITVKVKEAYPNCPKYIQQRSISAPDNFKRIKATKTFGRELTLDLQTWIKSSDTFFVGSQSTNQNMDASHRGGNPGFIEILDNKTLKIPDYQGNSMFNTFGNFAQNPHAGILFIDFDKGGTLQLTGKAEIIFDQTSEEDLIKTTGTGRFWHFKVSELIVTVNHHNFHWEFMGYSRFNPELSL
jgi:predicted pyridoxine 5'-phosphate oxidase superfamily flavin-nucleotide-binding protein